MTANNLIYTLFTLYIIMMNFIIICNLYMIFINLGLSSFYSLILLFIIILMMIYYKY